MLITVFCGCAKNDELFKVKEENKINEINQKQYIIDFIYLIL